MKSDIKHAGDVVFPGFSGLRIMMMPFHLHNVRESIPEFATSYIDMIERIQSFSSVQEGVGYLTVDEAEIRPGETHRRPGLHVDGCGAWGGGGGGYAANGMFTASTHVGCQGWKQELNGIPNNDGDCEHLRDQLQDPIVFLPNRIYWCGPHAIHESLPMVESTKRQFIRISMPSDAPWHQGYTVNPLGIMPTGPIIEPRISQMTFRP